MKKLSLLLFLLITLTSAHAQDTLKLKATAQRLLDATLKEDYALLIDFTYPKVIEMGGGKDTMMATIKLGMQQMKESGFTFHSAKLLPLGKIYKAGKELHCLLPHTLVLKAKGGYLSSIATLLCISSDEGKNWTYISAGSLDDKKLKTLFTNFNEELKLDKMPAPVFSTEEPKS